MPTYEYECPKCLKRFDDIKGIKAYDLDPSSACPHCEHLCGREDRIISAPQAIIGAKVTSAEYNPGLGCVIKNKRHKDYVMKSKGVVEVGNDFNSGEKQQTHFEKHRQEEKDRAWKNVVGEAEIA